MVGSRIIFKHVRYEPPREDNALKKPSQNMEQRKFGRRPYKKEELVQKIKNLDERKL